MFGMPLDRRRQWCSACAKNIAGAENINLLQRDENRTGESTRKIIHQRQRERPSTSDDSTGNFFLKRKRRAGAGKKAKRKPRAKNVDESELSAMLLL